MSSAATGVSIVLGVGDTDTSVHMDNLQVCTVLILNHHLFTIYFNSNS